MNSLGVRLDVLPLQYIFRPPTKIPTDLSEQLTCLVETITAFEYDRRHDEEVAGLAREAALPGLINEGVAVHGCRMIPSDAVRPPESVQRHAASRAAAARYTAPDVAARNSYMGTSLTRRGFRT